MKEGEVRRIEIAFHDLRPIALHQLFGYIAAGRFNKAEFHVREFRNAILLRA